MFLRAVVGLVIVTICFANISLPPGLDFFGPGVDVDLFPAEFKQRKCTTWAAPLIRWAKDYGTEVDGIEIKQIKNKGCGIVTTRNFSKDDSIIKLPMRIAWTRESASAAEMGKGYENLTSSEQLITFAAVEHNKGNKSMWAPYLDSTPTTAEMTNVLYWTEYERNMLEGSHLPAYIKEAMKEIAGIHEVGRKKFARFRKLNVTIHDVMWAWGIVHSRQVSFGDRDLQAVTPLIDLVNCGQKPNVHVKSSLEMGKSYLVLKADQDIAKGEELLIQIPKRENSYLAHNLGMALTNNTLDKRLWYFPNTFPEFTWGLDHQQSEVRKEFFKYIKMDGPFKEWYISLENGTSYDFINAARARTISVRDVSDASHILPRKAMYSKANEVAAINQILNLTMEREKKYVSTPDEDRALLKTPLTQRERIAIQIRLGEKQMLTKVIEKLNKQIASIKASAKKKTKKAIQAAEAEHGKAAINTAAAADTLTENSSTDETTHDASNSESSHDDDDDRGGGSTMEEIENYNAAPPPSEPETGFRITLQQPKTEL